MLARFMPKDACLWTYTHPYDGDDAEGFVRLQDGTPLWANMLLMHHRKNYFKKLLQLCAASHAPPLSERVKNMVDLPCFSPPDFSA
jgi:hypothetical protein